MRILAIGDPHGKLPRIPKNIDVILVTGDLGSANLLRKMSFENLKRIRRGLLPKEFTIKEHKRAFLEAYNSSIKILKHLRKHAPVFTIFGNVENTNPETREIAQDWNTKLPFLADKLKKLGVRIINNRVANFNGIRIAGLKYFTDTSWIREFKPLYYRECLASAKKATDKVRRTLKWFGKVDILVTHQPPYGILDRVTSKRAPKHWRGKHAGSKAVLQYIKRYKPMYVLCGHIHEGKGMKKIGKTQVFNLGISGHKLIEL